MVNMISKLILKIFDGIYDFKEKLVKYSNYRFETKTGYWKDKDVHGETKSDNF